MNSSAHRILVENHEGMWLLGKPRCRWEDNIKMDLKEMDCDAGDWIDVAEEGYSMDEDNRIRNCNK